MHALVMAERGSKEFPSIVLGTFMGELSRCVVDHVDSQVAPSV